MRSCGGRQIYDTLTQAVLLVLVQQSAALVWSTATRHDTTVNKIVLLTAAVSPLPLRNRWQHHIHVRAETHGPFLRNHHPQMS
jgi:hypothetical protein